MKLYIVADMEGATGVVHRDQLLAEGGAPHQEACRLLTGDINAVIEGAVAEGVTEVVVSEGHATMRHVLLEALHPAARLVKGPAQWHQKPHVQVAALDKSFGLGAFVGFHSRAGTPGGLLSHTWAGAIVHEITVNGKVMGETALDALLLGAQGVPVGLVVGGDDVAREAQADLGNVEVAVVKRVLGPTLAECWGPKATGAVISAAARKAVKRAKAGEFKPYVVKAPVVAELETHRREMADRMAIAVPGLERIGERRVRTSAGNAPDAISTLWHAITEAFHEPAAWLK